VVEQEEVNKATFRHKRYLRKETLRPIFDVDAAGGVVKELLET
jgi:cellulose biosynthesis protein BcsQ